MEREIKALIRIIALAVTNDTTEAEKAVEWAYNGQEKPKRAAPQKKAENTDAVERIYALYPASTIRADGGKSTLRSAKDKEKIARVLATKTEEELAATIKQYLTETDPRYLKMLATFLNQIPDYADPLQPHGVTTPSSNPYDNPEVREIMRVMAEHRK